MNILVGLSCGSLIRLKCIDIYNSQQFLTSTIKLCTNSIGPIINIDKENLIIGLAKKFFEVKNFQKSKKKIIISSIEHEFTDACLLNNPSLHLFVAAKNFIYVWKKNLFNEWSLFYKIISKYKINFMSKLSISNLLITSYLDNNISLWNIFENKILFCGKTNIKHKIIGIDGSPYNDYYTIRTIKGNIELYTNTGFCIKILSEQNSFNKNFRPLAQYSLKFYSQTTFISGGASKKLSLWDFRIGKIVKEWSGHCDEIRLVDCIESTSCSYRNFVVSCDFSNTIKLWDLRSSKEFRSFKIGFFNINSIKIV